MSAKLEQHPAFEQEARQRWVDWYLRFSQQYSNEDAGQWQCKFDGLDEEWQNLQAVANWCMAAEQYDTVLQLWENIKPYIYVVGRRVNRIRYWSQSLLWLDWLTQTACQRGDWSSAVKIMFDSAWILIATGKEARLDQADQLLNQAWELRNYWELKYQINLARYIAILKNKQCKFAEASIWLGRSEELLDQAELEGNKRLEYLSHTRYYQGIVCFKVGEIEKSKIYLQEAHNYAASNKLERLIQVIETALADVAIQQSDFIEAEQLLVEGLRIAEANLDDCRVAFIKQSFAGLTKSQGNFSEAQRYASESLRIFESLGMVTEAEEVQAFIENELSK